MPSEVIETVPYYISLKKKGTVISVVLKHIAEHT